MTNKTDEELYDIVYGHSDEYIADAVEAAKLEFSSRNVAPETVCHLSTAVEKEKQLEEAPSARPTPAQAGWDVAWFMVHLALVYLIATDLTPWLGGWVQRSLLPELGWPKSVSGFQFLFSHLLVLSFVPAFVTGLANVRLRQKVVAYVWLVPGVLLGYKLVTFPTTSVFQSFQSHASSALHQYFGGGFLIPDFRNWQEFWSTTVNADAMRGMEQLHFTAPFYAGVAYSIAAWISSRIDVRSKLTTKFTAWEAAKFGPRQH